MKFNKPKFWDNKFGFIAFFLVPLSLIVILFIFLKKKFSRDIKFNIPVICVGNIYVGGTGKTPASILIAKELERLGKNPAICRKFYKEHKDEHNLIKNKFKNLLLDKDRAKGIIKIEKLNHDVAILDDGFQDYKIKKDLSILCFNQRQLVGNGLVFPAGPLRESLSSMRNAQIVLINGMKDIKFEKKILNINKNLQIFYTSYKPLNIDEFKGKKLLALAGIGNPNNFFQLLLNNNLQVEKKLIYPDHYEFSRSEINIIIEEANRKNYQIITTEKDYFRISNFEIRNIKYLKTSLEIYEKEKLLKTVCKIYD
jgi:tetraacyldisaccharide 4'-kinase